VSARARRSSGGDAEKTMNARERKPEGKWRCPRDRGRRGDLEDTLGADKRDQQRHTDATSPTRGVTGELLPTDAASIQLQSRLKLDFELRLSPKLIDDFAG